MSVQRSKGAQSVSVYFKELSKYAVTVKAHRLYTNKSKIRTQYKWERTVGVHTRAMTVHRTSESAQLVSAHFEELSLYWVQCLKTTPAPLRLDERLAPCLWGQGPPQAASSNPTDDWLHASPSFFLSCSAYVTLNDRLVSCRCINWIKKSQTALTTTNKFLSDSEHAVCSCSFLLGNNYHRISQKICCSFPDEAEQVSGRISFLSCGTHKVPHIKYWGMVKSVLTHAALTRIFAGSNPAAPALLRADWTLYGRDWQSPSVWHKPTLILQIRQMVSGSISLTGLYNGAVHLLSR